MGGERKRERERGEQEESHLMQRSKTSARQRRTLKEGPWRKEGGKKKPILETGSSRTGRKTQPVRMSRKPRVVAKDSLSAYWR